MNKEIKNLYVASNVPVLSHVAVCTHDDIKDFLLKIIITVTECDISVIPISIDILKMYHIKINSVKILENLAVVVVNFSEAEKTSEMYKVKHFLTKYYGFKNQDFYHAYEKLDDGSTIGIKFDPLGMFPTDDSVILNPIRILQSALNTTDYITISGVKKVSPGVYDYKYLITKTGGM